MYHLYLLYIHSNKILRVQQGYPRELVPLKNLSLHQQGYPRRASTGYTSVRFFSASLQGISSMLEEQGLPRCLTKNLLECIPYTVQ